MRSLTRKVLAVMLCLTVALALVPATASLKTAQADSTTTNDYLVFTSTGQASITPKWTDATTSIRYTTTGPSAGASPVWTAVTSGTAISFNGSLYLEGTSTNKSLFTLPTSSNAWTLSGTVAASGTPNALLKDAYGGSAWSGALGANAFADMFRNWASLTSTPDLPSAALANSCYYAMFYGCRSLMSPPALPATTLASACYHSMFSACTSLADAPSLPATGLVDHCYTNMFSGCLSLMVPPELPATSLALSCYDSMFSGAGVKVSASQSTVYPRAWKIPTTGSATAASGWNSGMLGGSAGPFTDNPSLNTSYYVLAPATSDDYLILSSSGGASVTPKWTDSGTSIRYSTTDPSAGGPITWHSAAPGSAISFNGSLYFEGKSSNKALYIDAASGNAWTISGAVAASGNLSALLKDGYGIKSWDGALGSNAFAFMFNGCASLTSAPALPATTLGAYSYVSLFSGCTALANAPALPATTLADTCCSGMFAGCTSLTSAPALPATVLAEQCYYGMFNGCTDLKVPPALPATTLAYNCYRNMFKDSGIKVAESESATYARPWRIPTVSSAAAAESWNLDMLSGTGGSFSGDPSLNTTYYTVAPTALDDCLVFSSSGQASVTPVWADPTTSIRYTGDDPASADSSWHEAASGSAIAFSGSIYLEGTSVNKSLCNTTVPDNAWSFGGSVAGSGSVTALFKDGYGDSAWTGALGSCAFSYMFYGCDSLTSAPALPSTTLAIACYLSMFQGCTALTRAPALPATTLAPYCYAAMFQECSSIALAPDLPATTLATYCYSQMFADSGLRNAPALPATTLADHCYYSMFESSLHLTNAAALPATALTNGCYQNMLSDCQALVCPPDLPATTLADSCYANMFQNSGIKASLASNATYNYSWRIPSAGTMNTGVSGWSSGMLGGTAGSFSGDPAINTTYYLNTRADQPDPAFMGSLPTVCNSSATITPTGSLAGAGYTVASSDSSVAGVSDNRDGSYTVQVVGGAGTTYSIAITALGNDDYNASATYTSLEQTISASAKADQLRPGYDGTLPTAQGSVAVITPTGSLAGAGYEVASSDPAVATVLDNEDGTYTVRVAGQPGDVYRISITANGNADYNVSPTYTSGPQTVRAGSHVPPNPDPTPNPAPVPGLKLALPQASYDYTGKAIKPVPVVNYKGQALLSGRDYKLTAKYVNNKELGKGIASATYTVTGLGNNSFGTATQTLRFSIGLAAPEVKKVKASKKALKVSLKSKVKGATSYILYYSSKAKGGFKHATLKAKGKSLTLKKKLSKKKYYVKVIAYAPKAYKKLVKAKSYKAPKSKKLALKWTASPYAGKYRIAYKLKGAKKWSYKSASAAKSGYSLKHLKKNKKYSVALYYQTKAFKSGYGVVKA